MPSEVASEFVDVVVIGSGFGGAMTSLSIAAELKKMGKGKVRVLERGTWWTTPVGTVKDPEVKTAKHLAVTNNQPVQYWSSINHFRGALDIVLRCVRRKKNEDGLYDVTFFGRKGLFGFLGRKSDGVSVLRAAGVGGGSLVYSNITIRPPEFVLD